MGLTMSQRKAVTKTVATRYRRADKSGKGRILDELCATTGWHRNHARKALAQACTPRIVRPRVPRPPKYGPKVVAALIFCWAVLGMPAGKRLAPILPELVGVLRRFDELDIDDGTAALLVSMSAATIDRRLAPERKKHELRGRSHTKPGSLLESQIPIRTWADWDDAKPGFVEVDLVGHDCGNAAGEHAYTLTVTDIATGWTENRSVRNKARKWVIAALDEIAKITPFPILGVDSDNGSEFINHHLLAWCEKRKITFTRSRPGNSNDGCHVEQKNWAIVRTVVGYHRYDTEAELLLLNKIWVLQSQLANYFCPQQKLVSKVRTGAKVAKKYDTATTPHRRAEHHKAVGKHDKEILADTYTGINPAAVQRQIQALTTELLTIATNKAGPAKGRPSTRALSNESTNQTSRAS
ncbi:transposase family protein [Rhodococcus sp. IEGM 1351]|uniref:integrase catalytic domain-containing protein n=1 Tax=Rhodococcus sp. IEGM 1351 TaxID=3047089 RepID=UPI0024B6B779|nr:transposase family protein [Rhodococcus sp. IEGM 1351]MDI9941552.1 transposase family protein [Rhodococcus sp. IEGM 1351]